MRGKYVRYILKAETTIALVTSDLTNSESTVSYDSVADAYERRIGQWSRLYIPSLLAAAHIEYSDSILDVATGTGEVLSHVKQLIEFGGKIYGCDISIPMLRIAKEHSGINILAAMDASELAFRDCSFDSVTCQLGLMFFPNRKKSLSEFYRVLRKSGRMAACVWSSEERTPFVSIFPDVMSDFVSVSRDVLADGTSLGDENMLETLVSGAGFKDIQVRVERHTFQFPSFEEYWEPIEAGGSPTAELYVDLPRNVKKKVREKVKLRMSPYFAGDCLNLDTEALIVSGQK